MNQHSTSARRGQKGMRLALISLGLTGLGIGATAGTSAAHNPNVAPSCTGLTLDFTQYEGPASNNTVTVTIDGAATVIQFDEGLSRSFPWSDSADHTWTVTVDANRETGDATAYDTSTSGTETACVATETTTPPTTAPATTEPATTVPATTEAPTTTVSEVPAAAAPTTTAPETPAVATTTAVANEAPSPPAATTVSVSDASAATAPTSGSTLPKTGSNTGLELMVATTVLLAGVWMIMITRRRTNARDHQS
jgi:LPXTG-motif cell wall-anchored protein